jgi:hypothetical protein
MSHFFRIDQLSSISVKMLLLPGTMGLVLHVGVQKAEHLMALHVKMVAKG